jgi:ribose transport system ATP-binding protein
MTGRIDEEVRSTPVKPLLEMRDIWKAFPGQMVLKGVSLELDPGEVRGLVGQNGSGKSTFIKVLSGYHTPATGALGWLDGKEISFGAPKAIHESGIRFVHQELNLIEDLSVVDNLALTNGYRSKGVLSIRKEAKHATDVLDRFGLDLDVTLKISALSPVERTLVAICRALGSLESTKLLVLDEPTAALPADEVARLFRVLKEEAARGLSILYVSHNLSEILDLADSITVLRDGEVVADQTTDRLDIDELVHLIAGREVEAVRRHHQPTPMVELTNVSPVLDVRHITGMVVDELSMQVAEGEIVGIAGLLNSGREELPYLIGGSAAVIRGKISLNGVEGIETGNPKSALESGIVLVAADRKAHSAIPSLTARENIMMPVLRRLKAKRWIQHRGERREAHEWMAKVGVAPPETEKILATFSGGNQQKIVMARALKSKPILLVLDEPVQGVDVAAKASIFEQLLAAAKNSKLSIVIASSDPEDLVAVCDRVLVMIRGRIAAELVADEISGESILSVMSSA